MNMNLQFISFEENSGAPYSDIVVEGKTLYLSGLVSEDMETGELVSGDITTETRQVFENLAAILAKYGSDMEHVVRVEVLLRDFSERDEMNAEYVRHFSPARMPARMCYGGVDLAETCKIEVMVTAVKREG